MKKLVTKVSNSYLILLILGTYPEIEINLSFDSIKTSSSSDEPFVVKVPKNLVKRSS